MSKYTSKILTIGQIIILPIILIIIILTLLVWAFAQGIISIKSVFRFLSQLIKAKTARISSLF